MTEHRSFNHADIAAAVSGGRSYQSVGKEFGADVHTIKDICLARGVVSKASRAGRLDRYNSKLRTIQPKPFVMLAAAVAAFFALVPAHARDAGQWAGESPSVQQWFRSLMQPDNPMVSCCGAADGFPVDHWKADGIDFDVTLEDGRTFHVPATKAQWKFGNPTGRDVLFVSNSGTIYCFVLGAGI